MVLEGWVDDSCVKARVHSGVVISWFRFDRLKVEKFVTNAKKEPQDAGTRFDHANRKQSSAYKYHNTIECPENQQLSVTLICRRYGPEVQCYLAGYPFWEYIQHLNHPLLDEPTRRAQRLHIEGTASGCQDKAACVRPQRE